MTYQMLRSTFRYAFFTCYNETIFLRMNLECSGSDPNNLFPRLFYSDVIIEKGLGNETKIPVGLELLYLLKLANGPQWAFKGAWINLLDYTAIDEAGKDLDVSVKANIA